MDHNFSCLSCGKQHSISSYSFNGTNYLDKKSKQILRCDCVEKTILDNIPVEWDGSAPNFGKVASMSPSQRSEVLKKRSKDHSKKEILDRKRDMTKQFNENVKTLRG